MVKTIGVLALQGDFREHIQILKKLKVNATEVRTKGEFDKLDGLIIPGGESTTITNLLRKYHLDSEIKTHYKNGMAIWGTCAGAIILAKKIDNHEKQPTLGLIDITINRNAYGRQIDSFEEDIRVTGLQKKFHAIFIRAPIIENIGDDIEILAKNNSEPVLIKKDNILISTFHPELTNDTRLHRLFLKMV